MHDQCRTEQALKDRLGHLLSEINMDARTRAADYIGDLGAASLSADLRQIQVCARSAAQLAESGGEDAAALLTVIVEKIDTMCARLKGRRAPAHA